MTLLRYIFATHLSEIVGKGGLSACVRAWDAEGKVGALQVKNLERRTEEDVPYSDVARFLMAALPRFQQREALSRQQLRELAAATHEEPDDRPGFEEMRRGSRKFDRR